MRLPPYVVWPLLTILVLALVVPFALDHLGYTIEPQRLTTETRVDFSAPAPSPTTTLATTPAGEAPDEAPPVEPPTARNIILLIGDGMGFSQLAAGRYATVGPNGRLALDRFPVTGWSFTHSVDELYTDSAAGATALATGHKTRPGRLSVDADGRPLPTIAEKAIRAGKAVGLVTDSALFDATPSAFVVHVESRRNYPEVGHGMARSGAMVLLGETRARIEADPSWSTILADFDDHGFHLVSDADQLAAAAPSGPLVGLFAEGSISLPDTEPSLPELASLALDRLRHDPDGFFLMVETEETDTYSHRNDFARTVAGVQALDQVARQMVDFARADGETLVLVTADHDTGGLAVLDGGADDPIQIRWATAGHTAEPVPVLAFGAGAERFSGVLDNTEIGVRLQELAGLASP